MKNINWEIIDDDHKRLNVYGGWLVKAYENVAHCQMQNDGCISGEYGYDWRVAMCFVPDANHNWVWKV